MTTEEVLKSAQWWLEAKDSLEALQSLLTLERFHWDNSAAERADMHRFGSLYSRRSMRALGVGGGTGSSRASSASNHKLSLNVCKSCCDTYTAQIGKDKVKVWHVTSNGDYEQQQRAEGLNIFSDGLFKSTGLYHLDSQLTLDSAVFGDGVLAVFPFGHGKHEKIRVERCFRWEFTCDPDEARAQDVRSRYRRKSYDRGVLKSMFPKKAKVIDRANPWDGDDWYEYNARSPRVRVIEAWHLPSDPDSADGRHMIVIEADDVQGDNGILLDEPWTRPMFPVFFLRRAHALTGDHGIGICEELAGIQLEINSLLRQIQQANRLLGGALVFVEQGSKVLPGSITNECGKIVFYSGTKPDVAVHATVSPEIYQQLWALYQRSYEIVGISQLQAQSQKPVGLDSGEALRVYSDIGTDRQRTPAELRQWFYVQVDEYMISLAHEISERNADFKIKSIHNAAMVDAKWADIKMDPDDYVTEPYPVNAMSGDPADRIAKAQELANGGIYKPQQLRRLLDYPDLKAVNEREDASFNLVEQIIMGMSKGEYVGPENQMELVSQDPQDPGRGAIAQVQKAYLEYRRKKLPQDRLELFLRWMQEAVELVSPSAPPPGPAEQQAPPPPLPAPQGPQPEPQQQAA